MRRKRSTIDAVAVLTEQLRVKDSRDAIFTFFSGSQENFWVTLHHKLLLIRVEANGIRGNCSERFET